MDSQYVSRTLAVCLSQGLAELLEQRPPDPIEFLALWILKYKQNQELLEQKSAHERQLEEEQRRLHAETLHQKLLQDEETRIRELTEAADESKLSPPDQGEDEIDAAQDPGDQTESETVKELSDPLNEAAAEHQEEPGEAAAGEEQTSEILNTDQSQSQDTQKENDQADVPPEENEPEAEKTEDSDERQTETEDKEEEDGA
ncbi:DPY30 domain containing 2 [Sinocyclocheilus anshuiensis]|uniref:DPY30 domain containing 2 n=1 Tax=Sinocyclocheilus anshuiensis TaxID=1608454 RepID=UPI0007B89602|nr:PREDICTED: DPY30 domain-containing protein 1-like [Sinocyclocheilus anshuiensis]